MRGLVRSAPVCEQQRPPLKLRGTHHHITARPLPPRRRGCARRLLPMSGSACWCKLSCDTVHWAGGYYVAAFGLSLSLCRTAMRAARRYRVCGLGRAVTGLPLGFRAGRVPHRPLARCAPTWYAHIGALTLRWRSLGGMFQSRGARSGGGLFRSRGAHLVSVDRKISQNSSKSTLRARAPRAKGCGFWGARWGRGHGEG